MSAPTIYRWDDPGAPSIASTLPSDSDIFKLWFHTVLKACLVTGYDQKPAAGWSMSHESLQENGTRFVLENGVKSGALLYESGVYSSSSDLYVDTFWACQSVIDIDNPLAAHSFEREYSDRLNTSAKRFHKSPLRYATGSNWHRWVVIANDKAAIILTWRNDTVMSTANDGDAAIDDCRLYVGACHDSLGLGGMAAPKSGNFVIAGLDAASSYSVNGPNAYFLKEYVSIPVGITGLPKVGDHSYSVASNNAVHTAGKVNCWLPLALDVFGRGESSLSNTTDDYHIVTLAGLRVLSLTFISVAVTNEWMVFHGLSYGQKVTMFGLDYVLIKDFQKNMANRIIAISLESGDWGY